LLPQIPDIDEIGDKGNAADTDSIDSLDIGASSVSDNAQKLDHQFSFIYPYANAPTTPSKLTVTELKGRSIDYTDSEDAQQAQYLTPQESEERRFAFKKPGFIAKKTALSASERGTALHTAMQYVNYKECTDIDGVRNELQRLTNNGFLSLEQAEAVDAERIKRFFASETGARVLGAETIKREFRFSLLRPAESYFPGGGNDKVLLQGIVDCFFEEEGELVIVDFKTDHVTNETVSKKAAAYSPQLNAYAEALESISGKNVKEKIVYFFAIDKACII